MARFGPLYHTRRARRNPGRSAGPGKETFILSDTHPVSAASDSDRLLGQAPIGSLILIFACVALLASLVTWIRNDAKTTFASIEYSITSALIMPEEEQTPQATQPPQL